nr:hypothetical protein [Tanacetum cinerariifolium]
MELVLEQTQQGTSYEVSVSAEGVEEFKIKVKIKGEKKEALFTLRLQVENNIDGDKDDGDENAGHEKDGGNMNDNGGKTMDKIDGGNKDDGGNINEEGASENEGGYGGKIVEI